MPYNKMEFALTPGLRRVLSWLLAPCIVLFASEATSTPSFDQHPWLNDLAQVRQTFATRYANLEWAVFDREVDLPKLFADTETRVAAAKSDAEARAAFDHFARKLGDGHVEFNWPQSAVTPVTSRPCDDFDASRATAPLLARADGYNPIETPLSGEFPLGILAVGRHRVGVLKIGMFSPHATPLLCKAALTALSIPADKPCDGSCQDRIDNWTSARFNKDFIKQIEALKDERIDTLLVDITGNGGGSEWAEAAARMLTPIRLHSERADFVRGEHWVKHYTNLEHDLNEAARSASGKDRKLLVQLAGEVASKKVAAATPCDSAPLWQRRKPTCSWLGEGFYASGLLASANPDDLRGRSWGSEVFSPMEYPYQEGIWRGPLIVLVDGYSASASEEFAAVLQDNRAALIVGEPTFGAGCGHTDGGWPIKLKYSGATLNLPDCVRIRADGSNEVRGIKPDLLIGWRHSDGPRLRASALAARLPDVLTSVSTLNAAR